MGDEACGTVSARIKDEWSPTSGFVCSHSSLVSETMVLSSRRGRPRVITRLSSQNPPTIEPQMNVKVNASEQAMIFARPYLLNPVQEQKNGKKHR